VECLTADAPDTVSRAAGLLDRQEAVAIIPGAAGHEAVAGAAAEALSRHSRETSLVLSGGATARRFCEVAQIAHLWILGELQLGVAAGYAVTEESPLVIKGGAAGDAGAVLEAMRWIRGDRTEEGGRA
jgi:uncharacterized protein YgbK (DUF1537 family)